MWCPCPVTHLRPRRATTPLKLATLLASSLLLLAGTAVPGHAGAARAGDGHGVEVTWPVDLELELGEEATALAVATTPEESVLRLQRRVPPATTWSDVEVLPVGAGTSEVAVALPTDVPGAFALRMVLDGVQSSPDAESNPVDVLVVDPAAALTLDLPADTDVVVGEPLAVSGTAPGQPAGQAVRLELDTRTGWTPVGRPGTTDAGGAFVLAVPTDWLHDTDLRVVLDGAGDADLVSPGFPVRVRPAYTPGGDAEQWRAFDNRARWDACQVIGYRVNTRGAPARALRTVRRAIAQLHRASGLRFEYEGATRAIPFREDDGDGFSRSDLTIAWASARQVPLLKGGTIGWGGVFWSSYEIVLGGISLERSADLSSQAGPGATWGNLLLHELGHAVGLDHVGATDQVMYPIIPFSPGRYAAGDLAGLAHQGAASGCHDKAPRQVSRATLHEASAG